MLGSFLAAAVFVGGCGGGPSKRPEVGRPATPNASSASTPTKAQVYAKGPVGSCPKLAADTRSALSLNGLTTRTVRALPTVTDCYWMKRGVTPEDGPSRLRISISVAKHSTPEISIRAAQRLFKPDECQADAMTPDRLGIVPVWDEGCVQVIEGSGMLLLVRRANVTVSIDYRGDGPPREAEQRGGFEAARDTLSEVQWSRVPRVASTPVPLDWHRIDNAAVGLSLTVPQNWVQIDIAGDDLAQALQNAGIVGVSADLIKKQVAALRTKNVLFIVDRTATGGRYVNNISGICAPNKGVPAQEQKIAMIAGLTRSGARDIHADDLEIGGRPAVKAGYTLRTATAVIDVVQFRVLMPGDRICAITVGAGRRAMPQEVDLIGSTLRPAGRR
ncbi:MAG TPA: hypothetical protein VFU43_03850 [Streptosporangiaceae bacterium]|nr:hypothetical protein [Streptosporangiaceae bacterium]